MSDIKMIDSNRLQGSVQRLDISSGSSTGGFEAICTITHDDIWTDCIFCKANSYTQYRFMGEGICVHCRTKMIERIRLILDFQ